VHDQLRATAPLQQIAGVHAGDLAATQSRFTGQPQHDLHAEIGGSQGCPPGVVNKPLCSNVLAAGSTGFQSSFYGWQQTVTGTRQAGRPAQRARRAQAVV
jgi:hypothetical protein